MAIKKFLLDYADYDIQSIIDDNIKAIEAEQERQLAELNNAIAIIDKIMKSKDENEIAELQKQLNAFTEIDKTKNIENEKSLEDYSFKFAYERYRTRFIGKKELAKELNISVKKLNKLLEEKGLK